MCCMSFISHKLCWLCQPRTYTALHVCRLTCSREVARSASLAAACVTPDSDALACRSASCPASCRLVCLSVYIASMASCKSPGQEQVSLQTHKLTQSCHHTKLLRSHWQVGNRQWVHVECLDGFKSFVHGNMKFRRSACRLKLPMTDYPIPKHQIYSLGP